MSEQPRVKPLSPKLIKTKGESGLKQHTIQIPNDPVEFEKLFGFNPTTVNVLVCTPCYGGQVFVNYMLSVHQMFNAIGSTGIRFGFKTITNESLITRARMTCVSYFLSHPEFTHLLFIDADISFNPFTIIKLLQAKKDVISAVYPKKGYEWDRMPHIVKESIQDGKINLDNFKSIQSKLMSYVVNFQTNGEIEVINGCVKVLDAPTGFMLIQRNTFNVLMEKNPDMRFVSDLNLPQEDHKPDSFWLFFDCMVDPVSKRYLSEDYAFSRLVQQAGLEVWVDVTSPINHTGTTTFEGNIWNNFKMER